MRRHEGPDEEQGAPAQDRQGRDGVGIEPPRRPNHPQPRPGKPFGGRLQLLAAGLFLTVFLGVLRLLPHMVSDPIEGSKLTLESKFPHEPVERVRPRVIAVVPAVLPAQNASAQAAPVAQAGAAPAAKSNAEAQDEEDYVAFGGGKDGESILIPSAAQCDATRATYAALLCRPRRPQHRNARGTFGALS